MDKKTEIVPKEIIQHQDITTFDPAQQVEYAQKAAKALLVIIDATKPLIMQGKRYLYFEHWQTIAKFFNTSVGIESTTQTPEGYIAKAVVYDKNGIIIGGAEASCMKDENNWKNKPDFQLRSMAQTRAMAKALRSIYGFVAVLAGMEVTPAEEMSGVEQVSKVHTQTLDASPTRQPTEKQKAFIKQLCRQKNISQEQVTEMAKGKTPSQLIEFLLAYQQSMDAADEEIANRLDY